MMDESDKQKRITYKMCMHEQVYKIKGIGVTLKMTKNSKHNYKDFNQNSSIEIHAQRMILTYRS